MHGENDPDKLQKEFQEALKRVLSASRAAENVKAETWREETEEKRQASREAHLRFDLKPRDVKKHLDRFVIKQEGAKRVLATTVCDHYHHVRSCRAAGKCEHYLKQNVIMLGPTGVGKTYLVRSLAGLIGVPFIKADATKFSETGYVGGDVEDLVRDLVQKADGDIDLAQCGMIYLDEVDKIASASNLVGRDVSGAGVQRGLLKIMEETEVPLRSPMDLQSQVQAVLEFQQKGKMTKPLVNTRHILFIVSGAFDGLGAVVERRVKGQSLGFAASAFTRERSQSILRHVRTEDFLQFGFEPEFIGRLPVRVVCDPLTEEDLYTILTVSEGSVLRQYIAAFQAYGIDVRFTDDALWEIAKSAAAEGTGARGLVTVLERSLRDVKFELPSSRVKAFTVTRTMIANPKQALDMLLEEERKNLRLEIGEGIRRFEEKFLEKSGLRIQFDGAACQAIQDRVIDEGRDLEQFLEHLLSNYVYGLGLIQKTRPREKFLLPREVIFNPNGVLDEWIKSSYGE
jgi:endopeptidase Clp ATP-binding regulatory subunit ClpX